MDTKQSPTNLELSFDINSNFTPVYVYPRLKRIPSVLPHFITYFWSKGNWFKDGVN